MSNKTRLIPNEAVEKALPMPELIEAMKQAFAGLADGTSKTLPRQPMFHQNGNIFALMPGTIPGLGVCGCKAAIFPGPATAKAGTQQSAVFVFSTETGALEGIVAAEHITVARTAASSAAATDLLALPDASVLCLMGAGRQAIGHARAICAIRPITEIRVWDIDMDRAKAACDLLAAEGYGKMVPVDSAEEAVRGAHVVCTVTKAREPILFGDWLMPGAHVNAVGNVSTNNQEIDTSVLKCSKVYVDQMEASMAAAGDILVAIKAGDYSVEEIAGEIGAVANGSIVGRAEGDRETITVFESIGLSTQDVAAAYVAMKNTEDCETFEF